MGKIYEDGKIVIKRTGKFCSVYGNDAWILNKYLGYQLFGNEVVQTGFPYYKSEVVFKKLDKLF